VASHYLNMTFEDELASAFDTLTERLRGEIDREVERRANEIDAARLSIEPAASPEPVVAAPVFDTASSARLTEAVRSIDAARSLTGVLDALLAAARAEEPDAEVWLLRGGQLHRWGAPGSSGAGPETPAGSLVVPIAIAGANVAFLYAEPGTQNSERNTQNLELLTRYAGRSLEALTAFKTARALTQRPEPAGGDVSPANLDAAAAEDDASARRYARLLVSEIKLYHEPAVVDGRRDRDLATRLGGEITRARVMYEQRVAPDVRERADYFHDELVRTLCNGDSSLLEVRS
jgi:hypothetical protein